jgi:dihydroflavonol-4-reductase
MTDSGKVLVTGASGFVGSAVARKLVERGFAVRALVRPASPRSHLADLDLDYAVGDLLDAESIRNAIRGVRYLFHVAADYRLWARQPADIERNNLFGTRTVMEEAMRTGVERVVYTSSVATLNCHADSAADESHPLHEDKAIGAYKRSKVRAERLVESLVGQGLPAVIVNPSTPIGPCDVKPTPTGRMIVEAAAGRMPAFVDTGLNMVHVDDVAAGHLMAFERGRIGERYILGGQNASLAEILATVAAQMGRRAPRLKLPRTAVMPVALASEFAARWTGREPLVTMDGLRLSKNRMYFTTAKAERELGYRARPYAEGIKDAIAWFRQAGYLRR